jgi:hypothetical protein
VIDPKILLDRIRADHPKSATVRAAITNAFEASNKFASTKAELAKGGKLTPAGQIDAIRAALPGAAKLWAAAHSPIAKLAGEAQGRRAALKVRSPEATDLAGAIGAMEVRQFLRSQSPVDRMRVLTSTNDVRILEAALSAAPELSGLTANEASIAKQVEARYFQITSGTDVAELEELESLVDEAQAAIMVARGELRNVVGMDTREFDAVVGPAINSVRAWLVKNGDGKPPLVCEVDDAGAAHYHTASPFELETGTYYKNADEWRASREAPVT